MAISIKETLQQRQWSLIPKLKGAPALARELLKKMVPEEELFKASFSGKNKDGNKLDDVQMEMIKGKEKIFINASSFISCKFNKKHTCVHV